MADSLTLNLTITAEQGAPRVPLVINKSISAAELREKVSEATKIPKDSLRLIFRGRMISADDTKEAVAEYKLDNESVLHCMGKPVKEGNSSASGSGAVSAPPAVAESVRPIQNTVSSNPPGPSSAAAPSDPLQAALQNLRSSNSPSVYQTGVTTLGKILNNITSNPMEEKYRKVKKQNAAFQRRLGGLPGGDAAMKACGFVVETAGGEESYVIKASAEAWPQLVARKNAVDAATRDAEATANQASAPPSNLFSSGANGFGSNSAPPMPAGMQEAVGRMMSNPSELQSMLQNPMVQQMMRNDPRFANNPDMIAALEQMSSNPAVAQQLSQMMSNPAVQQQMQSMMAQGGGMGMPNFPPAAPAQPGGQRRPAPSNSQSNGGGDDQQTEEEMIAEAIRRSLEDS